MTIYCCGKRIEDSVLLLPEGGALGWESVLEVNSGSFDIDCMRSVFNKFKPLSGVIIHESKDWLHFTCEGTTK